MHDDRLEDPKWTIPMAAAWVASRRLEAVETAARGGGAIARHAIEAVIKEFLQGHLIAWDASKDKAVTISPEHWRSIELGLARKRFWPAFAEEFGQIVWFARDGGARTLQNIIVSSKAVQQIFPAHVPTIAASARGRTQAQRDRARFGLRGVFGDKPLPTQSEMNNATLCREVVRWLAGNRALPKNSPEISNDSILRAAGRKK